MDMKTTGRPPDDWHLTDDLHAETGKGDPFAAAMRATRMPMLITDPRKVDNPIVFANDAFMRLTGYARHEVIGRNCRFLQGPETDPDVIATIRSAIASRIDVSVDILNYRKDGTTFWNALFISPVSNEAGELQFYFASQLDVSDRKRSEFRANADKSRFEQAVEERTRELKAALETQKTLLHEVDHRVKNNLQMIASLVLMQSRAIADETVRASLRGMLARIEALATVHRRLYQSDDIASFDLAEFVRDLVGEMIAASGQNVTPQLHLDRIIVRAEKAAPLALMVNELVTNALKHGFAHRPSAGTLSVRLERSDGYYRIEVSDDGNGMNVLADKSFGTRLVTTLARQLSANVEWKDAAPGTLVQIRIPDGGADR